MYSLIKIEGNRQTGKSTLLAHYIKDAQANDQRVLLTGTSMNMINYLEHTYQFKADKTTTSELVGVKNFNVLAIEEGIDNIGFYVEKYAKCMAPNFTIIVTGTPKYGVQASI